MIKELSDAQDSPKEYARFEFVLMCVCYIQIHTLSTFIISQLPWQYRVQQRIMLSRASLI